MLNETNFLQYAIKHYDHPGCDLDDFLDDLNRIKYLLKLLNKYSASGDLNIHLALNHIIIFTNTFGVKSGIEMLSYKLKNHLVVLNTFLFYLGLVDIDNLDPIILEKLRAL